MKKKLLALAIAGAFAVPAASALADSGNVTIYGQMNISYDLVDSGYANGQGQRTSQVTDNASRLGFKGSEDLGNGLSAIWQIESSLNPDGAAFNSTNSTGALAGRNTFVGLSGKSWGTVLLGRHDTPYKMATRKLDIFTNTVADNRNILGGGGSGVTGTPVVVGATTYNFTSANASAATSFDGRQKNVVAYVSPSINGFTGMIAYVAGAENALTSGQKKGNAWSLAGVYKNGPWFGSLAYEKHNIGTASTGTLASHATSTTGGVVTSLLADKEEHAWKLGLGYKWQAFKLGFVYEDTKDDFGSVLNTAALSNPKGSSDYFGHHAYSLNGAYAFGNNALKVAYTKAGDQGRINDSGAKEWSLGIDHHFSKRTTIYALYTKLNNDTNGLYGLKGGSNGGVAPGSANSDPSAWSVGINHKF